MARDAVAVTGAAGFIGRHTVDALARRSERVIALVRPQDRVPEGFPADVRSLDVGDPDRLRTALDGASRVVHLAARSGGIQLQQSGNVEIHRENRRLTRSVIEACDAAGVSRVFFASSAVVYRDTDAATVDEAAATLGPVDRPTGYAWSKISDEVSAGWAASAGRFDAVIGRFGNVYGPGGSFDPVRSTVVHGLIARLVDAPEDGTVTVWGDGTAVRSFIHVTDLAAGILAVLDSGDTGAAYNVDTTEPVSIRELAGRIRDLAAPTATLHFDASRPSGPSRRVPDNARLRTLGFAPSVPLNQGLAGTIDWYRAHRAGA